MRQEKIHHVTILGRCNDRPNENVISIDCAASDCFAYMDALRRCIESREIDYLIIEPYKIKALFDDKVF